jgi:Arc/MetJ-type ribon-helix-helix transcriptional regulator
MGEYYIRTTTMGNTPQSIRIPPELDAEVARFVEETGVHTSKSEFIREAVRAHLRELNSDAGIMALRIEQALARAESADDMDSEEIRETFEELAAEVDPEAVDEALRGAEEDVAAAVLGAASDGE